MEDISYEGYKELCEYLPCRDMLYYMQNIFVEHRNTGEITAVKYPYKSKPQVIYDKLKGNLTVIKAIDLDTLISREDGGMLPSLKKIDGCSFLIRM